MVRKFSGKGFFFFYQNVLIITSKIQHNISQSYMKSIGGFGSFGRVSLFGYYSSNSDLSGQ